MLLDDDIVKAIKYVRDTAFNLSDELVEALNLVRASGYNVVAPSERGYRGLKESKDFVDLCRMVAKGRSRGQLNIWLIDCQYMTLGELLKKKLNEAQLAEADDYKESECYNCYDKSCDQCN
jgi:hypothetical protein